MNTIGTRIAKIENLAGGYNSGNIYSICARPGNDKTHLCLYSAIHLVNKGHKILYLTDSMDIDKFYTKLTNTNETINKENISFAECYYLTIDKLKDSYRKSPFDFLILDPFDIYSFDIDIGQLKEFAKSSGVGIFLSKTIIRSHENESRNHLVLSDIKFTDEKTLMKFIAYSDIIIFVYHKESSNKRYISFGKNLYCNFCDELPFEI